jgi:toxin ParE1/3/4
VKSAHKTSRALEDLFQAAIHIARDSPVAAARFLDKAEEAFDDLLRMPEMGVSVSSSIPSLADLRRWSVPGFKKYLIFYRPMEDGIEVVRVLHGARDVLTALTEE